MTIKEIRPEFKKLRFHCPYCGFLVHQTWRDTEPLRAVVSGPKFTEPFNEVDEFVNLGIAECSECSKISVWMNKKIIYPIVSFAPKPDSNMPDNVKEMYEEASLVSIYSPRAAAVLLRVATERLTVHLGEAKGKLNTRIRNLAKREHLDKRAIKGFDILRVIANEGGAHDGLMDLTGAEGAKTVDDLFFAINYIVEKTMPDPAKNDAIDQMYNKLPENKRKGAEDSDKPKDKT